MPWPPSKNQPTLRQSTQRYMPSISHGFKIAWESFQKVVAASESEDYQTAIPTEAQNGTCILFTDGLRFDIAKRLTHLLNERGVEAEDQGKPHWLCHRSQQPRNPPCPPLLQHWKEVATSTPL